MQTISSYNKTYTIYVDGPIQMETYQKVTSWMIDHRTGRLEFTDPYTTKTQITTHRYSIIEE